MTSTRAIKWRITVLVFVLAAAFRLMAQDSTPPPKQNAPAAAQSSAEQTQSTDKATQIASETSTAVGAQTNIEKRLNSATTVLDEIMRVPEKGVPQDAFKDAKCILVIPSTLRFAFVFGGEHGKGVATCRSTSGWTAPAPVAMTGGSWGVQAGGEAVDLVMLVMSEKGMDALLTNKFKIGADASGAAGPVGREASGSTDWKFKSDILTYSRARGIFAGINLNGAVLRQDKDETAVLYGQILPFKAILSGNVPVPLPARTFVDAVRKYSAEARQTRDTGALLVLLDNGR